MNRLPAVWLAALAFALSLSACKNQEPAPAEAEKGSRKAAERQAFDKAVKEVPGQAGTQQPNQALPPGHPPLTGKKKPAQTHIASNLEGTVVETMDAAGYTYIQLKSGDEALWLAGPGTKLKVGDRIRVPKGMLMQNFHSQTLDRTFPEIFFVDRIQLLK